MQPLSASPDGSWLTVTAKHPKTGWDLLLMPLAGEPVFQELLNTEADEEDPEYSPDGQLIAYVSDISGQRQVYVMGASEGAAPGIPVGSAHGFRWGANSDLLYYTPMMAASGGFSHALSVVSIGREPELHVAGPARVIDLGDRFGASAAYYWDIGADGRVIGWWDPDTYELGGQVRVVVNWLDELERLARLER